MPYRLVGRADDRVDALLLESAREWGIEGAARYNHLLLAALDAITSNPALPGSRPVSGLKDVRSYHLRKREPTPTIDGTGRPVQAALAARASLQFQGRSSLSLVARWPRARWPMAWAR